MRETRMSLPSDPNDPYYHSYRTRKKDRAQYKSPPAATEAILAAERVHDAMPPDEKSAMDAICAQLGRIEGVGKTTQLEIIAALGRMLNGDRLPHMYDTHEGKIEHGHTLA